MTTPDASGRGRTEAEIVAALDANAESCAAVARTLGFSRQNLHIRAKTSPAIRQAIKRLEARAAEPTEQEVNVAREAITTSTTFGEVAAKLGVCLDSARRIAHRCGLDAEVAAMKDRQRASVRHVSDDQIAEAIATHGGINRAARALGIKQPSLSKRLCRNARLAARVAPHRRTGRV